MNTNFSFCVREVIHKNVQTDWRELLIDTIKPFEQNINNALSQNMDRMLPAEENIFRCFNQFDIKDTKCIILGQDPYHVPFVADGLAFSTTNKCIPPSLRNVFKEIERSYGVKRIDPDLTDWAQQGCLLLNMSLSVMMGDANSHSSVWNDFVKELIKRLVSVNDTKNIGALSVALWGNYAQSAIPVSGTRGYYPVREDIQILRAGHPSPLNRANPFIGCDHFVSINEWNTCHGKGVIAWVEENYD